MNRMKTATAALLLLAVGACTSYSSYQKAVTAEKSKNWDDAVTYYEKALDVSPDNTHYRLALTRARLEASRVHFERGKSLRNAAQHSTGPDQYRLAQMAATELELTVKLDSTNQYAAIELEKAVAMLQDYNRAADGNTIDAMKKRAKANTTKAQPPVLNPASDQPISLNFSHETPVKDIYRALGNAFGINILYDQAVKDDRISIELKDVTAQQALERVMQASTHFYKVLDEHTIIIVPDNPQARRDYEDLVIRTFYLSNGDAEQVTNVVRTMIEARNVFPLKALNAITIRDTRDKVLIAEKIIEANDKAKAEVVVDVELLQLDTVKLRDIGVAFNTGSTAGIQFGAALIPPTGTGTTTTTTGTGTTTTTTSVPPGLDCATVVPKGTTPTASVDPNSVVAGTTTSVTGGGFAPNELLDIDLCSSPVHLASVTADGSGGFRATVTVPAGTAAGAHTIVVSSADGLRIAIASISVTAPAGGGGTGGAGRGGALARTGDDSTRLAGLAALALIMGAVLVRSARRTRRWPYRSKL